MEPSDRRPSGADRPPFETFKDPADAIGDPEGVADLAAEGRTKSDFWIANGFTVTRYFLDSEGMQHTAFYNPKTRDYGGGHLSSSND